MNKEKIKKAITEMFLSCPNEDQFSCDIVETLNAPYEYLYGGPKNWNHAEIEYEENVYFKQSGVGYFISWMTITHKDKFKRMPDRSKATFWNIAARVCSQDVLLIIHKLIGRDIVRYVGMQNKKT